MRGFRRTHTPSATDFDEDGSGEKRGATWQMMKNKGLTAHKKKLNRCVSCFVSSPSLLMYPDSLLGTGIHA